MVEDQTQQIERGKHSGGRTRGDRCLPTWFLLDDTCEDLSIERAVGRVGVLPLLGRVGSDPATERLACTRSQRTETRTGHNDPTSHRGNKDIMKGIKGFDPSRKLFPTLLRNDFYSKTLNISRYLV